MIFMKPAYLERTSYVCAYSWENHVFVNRYTMTGRGICEKIPVAGRKISRADRRGKFDSQDWYFSQIPLPVMIYLFNYTEYQFLRDNCSRISCFLSSFILSSFCRLTFFYVLGNIRNTSAFQY